MPADAPRRTLRAELLDAVEQAAALVAPYVDGPHRREFFEAWESRGVHVTPVDYYQPIPDTRTLPDALWERPFSLEGLSMNEAEQVRLVSEVFPTYRSEYELLPHDPGAPGDFHLGNGMFDGMDAFVYYCMVRHLRPKRIVEVGSGFSVHVALRAAAHNGPTEIIAIDPYLSPPLERARPLLTALHLKRVQDVDIDFFRSLGRNDILFVDSSHVSRIGSDVNYLVLEVLPRLRGGVAVHFHDVFWPHDYPKEWIFDLGRYWSEQYLLQAFLAYNNAYRVVMANNYLAQQHEDALRKAFPRSPWWGGGSLWIQREASGDDRHSRSHEP